MPETPGSDENEPEAKEAKVAQHHGEDAPSTERPPLGQRLYERPFLLLVAGLAIMTLIYTAWGLWEILTLPPATLP